MLVCHNLLLIGWINVTAPSESANPRLDYQLWLWPETMALALLGMGPFVWPWLRPWLTLGNAINEHVYVLRSSFFDANFLAGATDVFWHTEPSLSFGQSRGFACIGSLHVWYIYSNWVENL
jgi:hypothetical protein